MKAVYIEKFGGPEVLQYGDMPDPVAGPGEVVVDVVAASVNAADWKVRAGEYSQATFPLILGRDFSGTVAATGARCRRSENRRRGVWRLRRRQGGRLCRKGCDQVRHYRQKARHALAYQRRGAGACRSDRDQEHRRHAEASARRNHPHSRRRRRRRELCHPACQASRRSRDHDDERGKPRLCARPRPRPSHRLQRDRLHAGGQQL